MKWFYIKVVLPENNIRFKPFEVKPGMTVAPQRRRELSLDLKNCLDEGLGIQVCLLKKLLWQKYACSLYLSQKLRYIDDQYTLSKGTLFICEMKAQVINCQFLLPICFVYAAVEWIKSVFNMNRDVAKEKLCRFLIISWLFYSTAPSKLVYSTALFSRAIWANGKLSFSW